MYLQISSSFFLLLSALACSSLNADTAENRPIISAIITTTAAIIASCVELKKCSATGSTPLCNQPQSSLQITFRLPVEYQFILCNSNQDCYNALYFLSVNTCQNGFKSDVAGDGLPCYKLAAMWLGMVFPVINLEVAGGDGPCYKLGAIRLYDTYDRVEIIPRR